MHDKPNGMVTQLLSSVSTGDEQARSQLIAAVYDEMRTMARCLLSRDGQRNQINTTALVHDAYVRVFGEQPPSFSNRREFFGAMSLAMRRHLVDCARQFMAEKRGGRWKRFELDPESAPSSLESDAWRILAVDEAVSKLEMIAPRAAEIVRFRFYGGLSVEDAAEMAGVARRTAQKDLMFASAFLREQLSCGDTTLRDPS